MMTPILPEPGDRLRVMGLDATVTGVEPENDWTWRIELTSTSILGNAESWTILLPSDFHTVTGTRVDRI